MYKSCKFYSFQKISVFLSQDDNTNLNENIEFVYNYEENYEILDRNKTNEIVEILSKYSRSVKIRYKFTVEVNENFKKLKNDVKELNENINKDSVESSELNDLKPVVNKLIDSCFKYQILEYSYNLTFCEDSLNNKSLKYTKKYLYKCVLKQLINFVYEETENQAKDYAVCLKEFKNKANVTKLKSVHLFCSDCIEK